MNLVRNAFEALAAAQPLQPMLVMQTQRAESGGVEFAVIDNGEGIDPEFWTGSLMRTSARVPVGWAWAWRSAEPSSRPTRGGSASHPVPAPGQASTSGFRPAVSTMDQSAVYIVDDDPDMRDSLRWLMKTVGLRAETFASAAEFLRDFAPDGPGCVILDVRMPGTSGLDLFEELVARGEGMPVIFITAYADVTMAVRAMKSGAVEFVEKPFNRQTLLDKVHARSRTTPSAAAGSPLARSWHEIRPADRQGARGPRIDQGGAAK